MSLLDRKALEKEERRVEEEEEWKYAESTVEDLMRLCEMHQYNLLGRYFRWLVLRIYWIILG